MSDSIRGVWCDAEHQGMRLVNPDRSYGELRAVEIGLAVLLHCTFMEKKA